MDFFYFKHCGMKQLIKYCKSDFKYKKKGLLNIVPNIVLENVIKGT